MARTRLTISIIPKGFVMYSSAPASNARTMSNSEFLAVTIMTGTRESLPGVLRMRLRISRPSTSGSMMSKTTTSGMLLAHAARNAVSSDCPSAWMPDCVKAYSTS